MGQHSGGTPWLNMFLVLLLAAVSSVHGHGGMVWPPIWQDGVGLDIEEVYSLGIQSDPVVVDPKTGREINNVKSWGTDQTYTGGHGNDQHKWGAPHHGEGPHTNFVDCNEEMDGDYWTCAKWKHPWAAPGRAPLYGGGCGIHGLNPFGCPAWNDTRPPGSLCRPPPEKDRGTWSFGSSALEIDFPQAITTQVGRCMTLPVAFMAIYHGGGYTYRLCNVDADGPTAVTEECFANNVLEFVGNRTYWREVGPEHRNDGWQWEDKTDVTEGTYPEGSAWRKESPIGWDDGIWNDRIYKDFVRIPCDLKPGQYVLSWRWDAMTAPQIWSSCANIEIV